MITKPMIVAATLLLAVQPLLAQNKKVYRCEDAGGRVTYSDEACKGGAELKKLPVIISCQGGEYTNDIYPKLRAQGWTGYWIDAASARAVSRPIPAFAPVTRQTHPFMTGTEHIAPRTSSLASLGSNLTQPV